MAVPTCCIPAAAGVTAGAVVVTALGYVGDRCRGKGKAEGSDRQLQNARSVGDHPAPQKANGDPVGVGGPSETEAQSIPAEIQARMDNLHRILEAAVDEKKAGALGPALEDSAQTSPPPQVDGRLSSKAFERGLSAQSEEGLEELHGALTTAEGKYQQAEQRVLQLEGRLQQLEVTGSPRAAEAGGSLDLMQVPELQESVQALSKAVEDKEKLLEATKVALQEQESRAEEFHQQAQSLAAKGADLEQYQELTKQMKRTAELREAEVSMLGKQLGEAQAEADALRNKVQQTEAVLNELHARLKEQEEVLQANSPSRWEDMRERCQEAEGQYQQLQRQLHEEMEQSEMHKQEKEQHLQALSQSASEHASLSKRADDLAKAVAEKDVLIHKLQEAVQLAQAGGADHEALEQQVASLEASLVQLKQHGEEERAAIQTQLKLEAQKAERLEKAMHEVEAEGRDARRAAEAAQQAAALAQQEAAELRAAVATTSPVGAREEKACSPITEEKALTLEPFGVEDKAGSPCSPTEAKSLDDDSSPVSPDGGPGTPRSQSSSTPALLQEQQLTKSRLTLRELQALQVRLASSESRLKAEEAKRKDLEGEIAMLRKELAARIEEGSAARQEVPLAQGVSPQNKAEQAAKIELLMAQLEAERAAAGQQVEAQRQAFERQLEEAAAAARSAVDTSALESENKLLRGEVAALKAEIVQTADTLSMTSHKGNSPATLLRGDGSYPELLIQTAPPQPPSAAAVGVPAARAVQRPLPTSGQRLALAPATMQRAVTPNPGSSANAPVIVGASSQAPSRPVVIAPTKAAVAPVANPSSGGVGAAAQQQRPRRTSAADVQPGRLGRVPASQAAPAKRATPREPLTVSAAAAGAGTALPLSASMTRGGVGNTRRPLSTSVREPLNSGRRGPLGARPTPL